jgi:hypothetical protein
MEREEPVVPDREPPGQGGSGDSDVDGSGPQAEYDAYDEADAESFPASDPPAATEPNPSRGSA